MKMNVTEGIILPLPSSNGMGEQSIRCTLRGARGKASENSNLYLLCGAEQSCADFFFISMQSKVENYLLVGIWVLRHVRDPVTLLAPTGYSGSVCVWRRAGQRSRSSSGELAGAELRGPSSPLSSQLCLLPPRGQAVQAAAWGRARGLSLVPWVRSL